MAGGNGVGPGFRSIGWDWLRTLLSLVITASLFHPGAPAAVKPIGEPEFNHLLEKAENGSLTAEIQVARAYASGQRGEIKYDEAAPGITKLPMPVIPIRRPTSVSFISSVEESSATSVRLCVGFSALRHPATLSRSTISQSFTSMAGES